MDDKALSIKHLTKTYKNGHQALKGASFHVNKGDFFALLGSNGAGKSTAINIIAGLLKKTSGRISIYGNDIEEKQLAAKSLTALVPQEINFHPYETLLEILVNQAGLYGVKKASAKKEAERLLSQFGLHDKRHKIVHDLSGGMKRQLMLARALMSHPKLLLLDEPTAGVDIEARHRLWEYLRETNSSGTTIILTTHHLEEAELLCNRFAIIQNGDIIKNADMRILADLEIPQTIHIQTKSPLSELSFLENYPHKILSKFELEIRLEPGKSIGNLLSLFTTRGIEILNFNNKSNKLEELFLTMTSQKQRNQDAK